MVMALQHQMLPPTMHAAEPSPHIDWSAGAVRLLTEQRDWPGHEEHKRRAGVSSFGISGTNAHVILEEAAPPAGVPASRRGARRPGGERGEDGPGYPWVVSGRGEAALRGQAQRLAAFVRAGCGGGSPADVGWSLASGRSVFGDRAVVLAGDAAGLEAVAAGRPAAGVIQGRVPDGGPQKVAFVFAGQGSQRAGMGRALAAVFPVFADAVREACGYLDQLLGEPVTEALFAGPGTASAGLVDQTVFTQAGLFAVQVALARLLQSWGITPDYLTGHSIGEIAAAHVAGVLSLADACALVAARGRLMQELGRGGAMAAVSASEEETTGWLTAAGITGAVIAAVNGPSSVVLSGGAVAVAEAGRYWRGRGVRVRRLRTSHAFHSPRVEPMLTRLAQVAAGLSYQQPKIPVVCGLTGQPDAELIATPGYWVRQAREAVRFADCVRWLAGAGAGVFAELGPDGTLSALGAGAADTGVWVPVLRARRPEPEAMLSGAAELFVAGVPVDWTAMFTGSGARRVDLPTYAFQRQRYWPARRPVKAASEDGQLFTVDWVRVTAAQATGGGWAVLAGDTAALGGLGAAGTAASQYAGFGQLAQAVAAGTPVPSVVAAWLPGLAPAGDTAVHTAVTTVLELVRQWLAATEFADSVLVIVTSPAANLAGAAVRGLIRSALSEHPGRFAVAETDGLQASWRALPGALGSGEPELTVRQGQALGRRLVRAATRTGETGEGPWRLDPAGDGTLGGLRRTQAPEAERPLAPGQVRIAVRAAGLNFRDALITLGVYPGAAALGAEGAGVVKETGQEVTSVAAGDRVMGLWDLGLASVVVAEEQQVAKIPDGWSFEQAASVPLAFAAAYYGLVDVAGLRAGESVLIHAAASGVGMAAAQLARHLGAQVFATASPAKQALVRELGVDPDRIASSRTLDFARQFRATTGGRGVDVVLDALTGEFVDASLGLVAAGGRFVEMGKADIRDPAAVAARWPGVSYRTFDVMDAGPRRLAEILAEVLDLFGRGLLAPLPVRTWDVARTGDALRLMGQGRHTGKNVLRVPAPLNPTGTVLITGGSGVMAALAARHLAASGQAGRLLLVSRRGPAAPGAARLAAELATELATELAAGLAGAGAQVQVTACDAADRVALAGLLDQVPAAHPLTAVMHAAGVLDEAVISALTAEQVHNVVRPKVDAALALDELTAGLDLSAFVLFSSVVATFGAPGQANRAAANAVLDALAEDRRARGRPAVSIAWDQQERKPELLDLALTAEVPVAVAIEVDLAGLRAQAETGPLPPLLRDLIQLPATGQPAQAEAGPTLLTRLAGLAEADQHELILDLIRDQAAAVLGYPSADPVRPGSAFRDLGFDSLTAVELRNRLAGVTGLRLPATLAFDHPTPRRLAAWLHGEIDGGEPEPVPASAAQADLDRIERMLSPAAVDNAESEQVATRLEAILAKWKASRKSVDAAQSVERKLEDASDDEVFDFLGEEFGISLSG
jgi:NADPH:quinone reductase-like Zn-dependent oxidoreductase/malonyl CoA-acyl carrier protein transacylase/acyl carrier protein